MNQKIYDMTIKKHLIYPKKNEKEEKTKAYESIVHVFAPFGGSI